MTAPNHTITLYVEHPSGGTRYRTRCTCGKYLSRPHGSPGQAEIAGNAHVKAKNGAKR